MAKILLIDSGIGGISTLCQIRTILPNEEFIYFADKRFMPYGNKTSKQIKQRVTEICCYFLSKHNIKAIVIACNTATACGIEYLREHFKNIIIIGVEPAIKPAIKELSNGKALVLVTPNTALQPKFKQLNNQFFDKTIIAPMKNLAALIENNINDLKQIYPKVQNILTQYLGQNIKSVVLGCTHYCFIKDMISKFFNAKTYDGNIGTALRLDNLLKDINLINNSNGGSGIAFFQSLC
ncbi:MAG: glutamate racemase [Firmicutes bacterium]|nr:glutamate racemase [Bacillota bacterium]